MIKDICVKCGSVDLAYRFRQNRYDSKEQLDLSCKRCHYSWQRFPNDHDQRMKDRKEALETKAKQGS